MWKFTEQNAFDSISLHDCRADKIELDGNDLILHFSDGFWITPASSYIDHDTPLKTGPAQVRIHSLGPFPALDSIDIHRPIRLFGKELICRRCQPDAEDFLKLVNAPEFELEFINEYRNSVSTLYECWIWRKGRGMFAECQFRTVFKSVEYCWNEILPDREW